MKIFFYALREYDEKKYVEKFAEQYSFEYGFTSDYPSMDNVELAEGYDAISIITNPMYPEILDAFHKKGVKYISTRSIGYEHIDIKYAHSIGMRAAHVVYSQNSVANYAIMQYALDNEKSGLSGLLIKRKSRKRIININSWNNRNG